jgi:4a-hydroxytetrahydrobiopterin dehydratase
MSLAKRTCKPCKGNIPALTRQEFEPLLAEIDNWQVKDDKLLTKTYRLKNFVQSLDLANKIGAISEEQGHHPDLLIRYGELKVDIWTHKINGLTEADFILAAKIDALNAQ